MVIYGFYYGGALLAVGALMSYLLGWPWGIPCYILAAFCFYFFRDPEREAPAGGVAVSPADGKVVAVVPQSPESTRISIFLNIFDVHVNRSPIAGKIKEVRYQPGSVSGGQPGRSERAERAEHRDGAGRGNHCRLQTNCGTDRAPHRLLEEAGRYGAVR